MQVIGLSPAFSAAEIIAKRSTRVDVADWATRVVRRHIKRTPELHRLLRDQKSVKAAAALDGLSGDVVAKVLAAQKAGEQIYAPDRARMTDFVTRALETMDFMESLPASDRRIRRIERLSWVDAEKMSEDWHAALAKVRAKSGDLMVGVRKIAGFDDGSFIGELTTAKALSAEGSAMGHCVGGYWKRVESGSTRIVSLRDQDGQPHVTIELSATTETDIDGFGKVRLMSELGLGVNVVMPTDVEWYAAQIRGKQNKTPVARYASRVLEWMKASGIPSREDGFVNKAADTFVVYNVGTLRKPVLTTDAAKALAIAADRVHAAMVIQPLEIDRAMRDSQAVAISKGVEDDAVVERFVSSVVDRFIAAAARKAASGEANALRVIADSGIEKFLRSCQRGRAFSKDYMAAITDFFMFGDIEKDLVSEELDFVKVERGGVLKSVVHHLPCLGLYMINADRARGMEERILNGLEPKLKRIVEEMRRRPNAYHVVQGSSDGARPQDIFGAFFACGLGPDYLAASAAVQAGVRSEVKKLVLELKALRQRGVSSNVAMNLLSDGYEKRLRDLAKSNCGGDPLVIGPEAPQPVASPRLAPAPAVKSYAMPMR